jgi:PASTA domain
MPQIDFSVINITASFFNESGKAEKQLDLALQFYNAASNAWQIISTAFSTEKGILSKAIKPTAKTAGFTLLKELSSMGSIPPFRLVIAPSLKTAMVLVVSEAPAVLFNDTTKTLALDFGNNFAQPETLVKTHLVNEANATTELYTALPAAAQNSGAEIIQLKRELAAGIKNADKLSKAAAKLESDNSKLQTELEKTAAKIQEAIALAEKKAAEAAALQKEMAGRDKAIAKMEANQAKAEALVQKRMSDMEGKLAASMQAMTELDKALTEKDTLILAAEVTAAGQVEEIDLLRSQISSLDTTIKENVQTIQKLNDQLKINTDTLAAKDRIIAQQAADYRILEDKLAAMTMEAVDYKPIAQPVSRVYSTILDEFKKTSELTKDSSYRLANISLNIKTFMELDGEGMRMQLVDANKLSGLPTEALSDFRVEIGQNSAATGGTVKVPDLLGLTETAARKILGSMGLTLKPVYQQSKTVPIGQSFKQSPQSGEVPPGSTITIVFSKI